MTLTFRCYMDFEVVSLMISTLLKNTSVILWLVLEYVNGFGGAGSEMSNSTWTQIWRWCKSEAVGCVANGQFSL
jgi:hypothetical protein